MTGLASSLEQIIKAAKLALGNIILIITHRFSSIK
jgi:hypothetical protein